MRFLEEAVNEPCNEIADFGHDVKNKLDGFNNKTEEKCNNSEEIRGNNICSLNNLNNLNNNDNDNDNTINNNYINKTNDFNNNFWKLE